MTEQSRVNTWDELAMERTAAAAVMSKANKQTNSSNNAFSLHSLFIRVFSEQQEEQTQTDICAPGAGAADTSRLLNTLQSFNLEPLRIGGFPSRKPPLLHVTAYLLCSLSHLRVASASQPTLLLLLSRQFVVALTRRQLKRVSVCNFNA